MTEVICDGGRPLTPVRYNWLRHGTWHYKITAVGTDGTPIPFVIDELDVYLAEAERDPVFAAVIQRARLWEMHHPLPLAINGREYRRRRLARRRRRRG